MLTSNADRGKLVTLEQPQSRKMKDSVHSFHGGIQNVRLTDIASDIEDLDTWIFQRVRKIFLCAAHEVVVDPNLRHILFDELIHCMRPDKPSPSDH